MVKNLQLSLLLILFSFILKGQTIGISKVQSETNSIICLGKKVLVTYTKTGTFNQDNIFKVQMKSSYSENWTNLETKDSSGYLVITLPSEMPNAISGNSYYSSDFRIASSSPSLVSNNFSYQNTYSLPRVELLGLKKVAIYPYEAVGMNVNVYGTGPITLLMSDSTSVKIDYNGTNQNVLVAPSKAGKFSILSVNNECGVGKNSGSVDIKIIDNSLKIIDIVNSSICKNSKINLHVIKSGKWTANNKFTIRLTNSNSSTKYYYDFEAIESDGIFSANIGSTIPYGTYNVKLLASDNGVESDDFESSLYVHNESKVELLTDSKSIRYGESQELITRLSGYGNHTIELSDGQSYYTYIDDYYNTNPTFNIEPKVTMEYFIKSFTSECGIGTGKNKVIITVEKGIKTDSVKAGKYCEGATVEVKFTTNTSLPIGSAVKIRMTNNTSLNYGNYKDVDATVIRENVVAFTIPTNLSSFFNGHNFYVSIFTDNIPTSNLSPNYITVSEFPSAIVSNSGSIVINLKNPQVNNIELILKGGAPYEITMTDSLKYKYNNEEYYWENTTSLPVFVPKTSVIAVRSISNVCGTNYQPYSTYKYVTVENAEYSIRVTSSLKTLNTEICAGNKLDLSLLTTGKYGSDNQFTVELISAYSSTYNKKLGTITVEKPQITIPTDVNVGEYSLRIASSNPLVYSNLFTVSLKKIPSAEYTTNFDQPITSGRSIYTSLKLNGGGPQTLRYKDGTQGTISISNYDGSYYATVDKKINKTSTFGLQSVSNMCGIGTVNSKDFTISVVPYAIENRIGSYYAHCLKDKIMVPFNITGLALSDASFSVQIANDADTNFTTLQSGIKQSPATVSLPSTFKEGKYKVRIVNNDNSIKSNVVTISLRSAPNFTLELSSGGNLTEIEAGNYVGIRSNNTQDYTFYNSPLRYVIKDDKNIKTIGIGSYNYIYENKFPLVTTTYTLISATNECGIGSTSGSVKVIVKPILDMDLRSIDYVSNFCAGSNADIVINSKGIFEADNLFKIYAIDENNVRTELLKTAKNGNYRITLGTELKKGVYKIQMESSNPSQTKDIKTVFITSKPDVSLLGQPTINAGNGTNIIIKNNTSYKVNSNYSFYDNHSYELSNGFIGNIDLYNSEVLNNIYVQPLTTQTYTIKSISNVCGTGKADGSATVTVNPPSTKQVNISSYLANLCQGSSNNVYFSTVGTFSATNKFIVQLSDITGKNFTDLETEGTTSPLKIKFPSNLALGTGYYLKVVASDKDATSITNSSPYNIKAGVTAKFDTSSYYFNSDKPVTIKVKFTGTPPFNFSIGTDDLNTKSYTASTIEQSIPFNPIANVAYRLLSVNNLVCGSGTILSPSTVRLELITAIEELGKLGINVFPNPTIDVINIDSNGKELDVQVIDFSGKIIHEEILKGDNKRIDLSKISSGTYFLHIQKEGKQAVFKILKQ